MKEASKKKNRESNKGKIRLRLILIMVALVAIPLAISSIVSTLNTIRTATDSAYETNAAQASIVEERINNIIETNVEALKTFAASPSTVAYLKGEATGEAEGEAIIRQLQIIDETLADGNSTALSGADGMQLLRSTGKLVDVSDREYYKEAIAGRVFISDMNVSKTTGKCISTFAVPVFDTDGKTVLGMVQRNYDLMVLHDLLGEEVTQDRQEIVMVDRTGTVVAHSLRELNVEDPEKQDQNPFYTDSRGDKTSGFYTSDFMGDTWIISWVKIEICGWVVASCRVKEVALTTVYKTLAVQIGLSVAFVLVGIFIAVFFSNGISRPIQAIGESLEALADGRFIEITGFSDRHDEFGDITNNANNVISKLKQTVSEISKGALNVDGASSELSQTSEQMSQNTGNVSRTVSDISNGAAHQADEIVNATHNMLRIEESVNAVQSSAQNLTDIAAKMQQASKASADNLSELKQSSENMNSAINDISEKINTTSDTIGKINRMVDSISAIANQTNLLALNASIEAARAGDAGKGFAVVAEEIGKLAKESNESADTIRSEMDALLTESQAAVEMADNVQKTNNDQQEVIESTASGVNEMIEHIEDTAKEVREISSNVDSCVDAKNVVMDAMSSLSAISQENAASSAETGSAMEGLSNTAESLSESALSLRDVSAKLSEEIGFFKI
ncbi:MAG: methyl-accepting chemotaxis protein [Lachnospiraceae bacterium]|nr:methyl-accepting chemotaxis protein [Lachnospiraceae bacterium]